MARNVGGLYARVGLELRNHERAFCVGALGMGVYLYCLLQARSEERAKSGQFSQQVLLKSCWGEDPRRIKKCLTKLVEAGLLEVVDDKTLAVVNYAKFNETLDDIEARRERDRSRKRPSEPPAFPDGIPPDSDPIPSWNEGGKTARIADLICSLSLNSYRQEEDVTVTARAREDEPPRLPPPSRTGFETRTPPPDSMQVTEELRTACFAAGAPEPTADTVRAFLAYAREEGWAKSDWSAALERWCLNEKRFARRRAPEQPATFQTAPGARRSAEELRQRDADRHLRIPPPADLLQAISAASGARKAG